MMLDSRDAYLMSSANMIPCLPAALCTHIAHMIDEEVMIMRLTIGSVMAIFRDHLQLGRYRHQYDLMDTLLSAYLCDDIDYVLHPTAVSAWLHGRRPVTAQIVGYYCLPGGDRKMAATIAAQILPHMPDRAVAAEQIIALVKDDPTIHPATRSELLTHRDDIAMLMACVLIYAMSRCSNYTATDLQDAA